MRLFVALLTFVTSSTLVASGVVLGIDAFSVAILGNAALTHGGTEAWQLGIAALAVSTLGGNVAGFGSALVGASDQ